MMNHFVARKIDELGRIVLVREHREELGLHPGDTVEMGVNAGCIMVRPASRRCALCGALESLQALGDRYLCEDCIKAVKEL